jgi:hypothetical protein
MGDVCLHEHPEPDIVCQRGSLWGAKVRILYCLECFYAVPFVGEGGIHTWNTVAEGVIGGCELQYACPDHFLKVIRYSQDQSKYHFLNTS